MSKQNFHCPNCKTRLTVTGESGLPRFKKMESSAVVPDYNPDIDPEVRTSPAGPSFWNSDGVVSILIGLFAGLCLAVFSWWYELGLAWVAIATSFVVGVGLAVYRIKASSPPKPPKPRDSIVKIETKTPADVTGSITTIEDLDPRINLDDVQAVAGMIKTGRPWSRASLMVYCHCTDYKARLITSEFNRLGLIEKQGNKYRLTPAGEGLKEAL